MEKDYRYPNGISLCDVITINDICLFEKEPHQVIDITRIESAIGNQFQPYKNRELAFASVYKSLVINHGFLNGNKRTAVIVLFLASSMLGKSLTIDDEDLAKLTYRIAGENGSHISTEEIADQVFNSHITSNDIKPMINGDLEQFAKSIVSNHQWLMNELAK